ncbi:MAG: hypothetical protein R3228_13940, partial [Halioglobus sp.]|nr:hypothetical protein [Halioglobus sp.]
MTQAAASRQQRKNGIRRHGLMGVYLASAPDTDDERELLSTCALNTELPLREVSAARYHLRCTGDSCELPDGVAVVVAGLPRFKDDRWQSMAQS